MPPIRKRCAWHLKHRKFDATEDENAPRQTVASATRKCASPLQMSFSLFGTIIKVPQSTTTLCDVSVHVRVSQSNARILQARLCPVSDVAALQLKCVCCVKGSPPLRGENGGTFAAVQRSFQVPRIDRGRADRNRFPAIAATERMTHKPGAGSTPSAVLSLADVPLTEINWNAALGIQ